VLEQQWLQIYRETVHPLYGYLARRTGGDRALTEDIVQESYLRALASWKHKTVPDTPLAWLKHVARNILIDHLRRSKWDVKAGPAPYVDADHRTPADDFESLEIFRAIASLGRKRARILEAFYYDGMSVREIAGEMVLSERAVEGLLRRARQSLRSLFPDPKSGGGKDA
jgi:RNA polymerase sigma-70 factor (ECF subfamily)